MMKKHLLEGAKKGAFTEAEAEVKFEAWMTQKTAKVVASKEKLTSSQLEEKKARLKAESKVNEARLAEIAKRNAAFAAAKLAPVITLAAPVAEVTPEVVAAPVAEVAPEVVPEAVDAPVAEVAPEVVPEAVVAPEVEVAPEVVTEEVVTEVVTDSIEVAAAPEVEAAPEVAAAEDTTEA
jgi:hypothetical protein